MIVLTFKSFILHLPNELFQLFETGSSILPHQVLLNMYECFACIYVYERQLGAIMWVLGMLGIELWSSGRTFRTRNLSAVTRLATVRLFGFFCKVGLSFSWIPLSALPF